MTQKEFYSRLHKGLIKYHEEVMNLYKGDLGWWFTGKELSELSERDMEIASKVAKQVFDERRAEYDDFEFTIPAIAKYFRFETKFKD